jgi:hypothetical protein
MYTVLTPPVFPHALLTQCIHESTRIEILGNTGSRTSRRPAENIDDVVVDDHPMPTAAWDGADPCLRCERAYYSTRSWVLPRLNKPHVSQVIPCYSIFRCPNVKVSG